MTECIGCRKDVEIQERNLCSKCVEVEKKHIEDLAYEVSLDNTCSQCGYVGVATDLHHIHGRKISNVVIRVCCNCHREIHAGVRELL